MKMLNRMFLAGLLSVASLSALADDDIGWSANIGNSGHFSPPVRYFRAAPVVVYGAPIVLHDAPVVIYHQSPQVVVLPSNGFDNHFHNQHFYGGQSIRHESRNIYRSHQHFQGRHGNQVGGRVYHRGSLYGTSGWR